MTWIDVSVPLTPRLPIYGGDPPLRIERVQSIESGDTANLSRLEMGVHTGTHVDAPGHFIQGAPGIEALAPAALLGPAVVVDATGINRDIGLSELQSLALPDGAERILFKTTNSRLWDEPGFSGAFLGLTGEAARELARRRPKLVGIDYLSVAPMSDPGPTHVALREAGVVILEGLDLRRVGAGNYELACLPLLIPGSDGAPARALLRPL